MCLSYTVKEKLLEHIGGHFNDKLVKAVKEGRTLRGTGDNLDIRILAHDMTSENQNKDLHYFAMNFIVNRLEFNLDTIAPRKPLRKGNRCPGDEVAANLESLSFVSQ